MCKLFTILFCVIGLFCGSVSAFKVDINKVPPECRNSLKDMETYSACIKGLEPKSEAPALPAPEGNNDDGSGDED